MAKGETPVEDVLKWYDAFEVPIEETASAERFRDYMWDKVTGATDEGKMHQIDTLQKAMEMKWERMLPQEVSMFRYDFKSGTQLRFTIGGLRGAFGMAGVKKMIGFDIKAIWALW